jgi:hypothetical protein
MPKYLDDYKLLPNPFEAKHAHISAELKRLIDFLQTEATPSIEQLNHFFSVQLKQLGRGASKTAYRHPTEPFVLKWGGNPKDEYKRAQANPTLFNLYLFPVFMTNTFMIQPLVDRTNASGVCKQIQGLLQQHSLNIDLHEGNVGTFQGKPVLIDF